MFTFWPNKWISLVPFSASADISFKISSIVLDTSWPLVFGTTQKEQYLLQPSMIETNAEGSPVPCTGIWLNFSNFGNEISTWLMFVLFLFSYSSGNLCSVWGPNTISTAGALLIIFSPSCDATHPPIAIFKSGFLSFIFRHLPIWWNTFSCAFSLIEQVLRIKRSASSSFSANSKFSFSSKRSNIFAESYSFIWQPCVFINNFFVIFN